MDLKVRSLSRRREGVQVQVGFNLGRAVVGGLTLFLVTLWGIFAHSSYQQWRLAREAAESNTSTLANLVEAWALSTLERLDYLAAGIEFQLTDDKDHPDELVSLLKRLKAAAPNLFVVIDVLDPQGVEIASSDPDSGADVGRNFDSDRAVTTPSIIGLPRMVGNRMLIPVLRPLYSSEGQLVGSVVVEIDPNYFAGFSSDLGLPPGASVELFRSDGPLLARNLPALGEVSRSYPQGPIWKALRRAPSGSFEAEQMDGVRRVVSYRTSRSFPLVVAIGFSSDQVFAETRRRIIDNGTVGLTLSLAFAAAAWALLFVLRQRTIAERRAAVTGAAVESVGNGVAVVEAARPHRVVFVNPAFGALLGIGNREILDRPLGDLLGRDAAQRIGLDDEVHADPQEKTYEVPLASVEGEPRWMEIRVAAVRGHFDLLSHIAIVMTDISERKRTEAALVQAKEDADAANRAKSDFLANMSHELRTPLNAVIGFADIIAQELFGPVGSERYREYAGLIRLSGTHLLEIISDILDLAKVEANQVVLDEEPLDIPRILSMCATLVAGRAEQAGVRVKLGGTADMPLLVADELRVKQIVLNLLSNAVKFSPPGAKVMVTAEVTGDGGIGIVVLDQGCGMSVGELKLALEPFGQVNSTIAKGKEGTGLGLPLARRMTEIHGGRLEIQSAPGRGTVARVLFPPARTRFRPETVTPSVVAR